jgi:hypothetical protein
MLNGFNEYELMELIKLRQEETERNARNAWVTAHLTKESFFQRVVRKFKSTKSKQISCDCICIQC